MKNSKMITNVFTFLFRLSYIIIIIIKIKYYFLVKEIIR